jgi:hypothetical protein
MSLGGYLRLLEWGAYAAFAGLFLSLVCVGLLVSLLVRLGKRR